MRKVNLCGHDLNNKLIKFKNKYLIFYEPRIIKPQEKEIKPGAVTILLLYAEESLGELLTATCFHINITLLTGRVSELNKNVSALLALAAVSNR